MNTTSALPWSPPSADALPTSGSNSCRPCYGPFLIGVMLWGSTATATSASPDFMNVTPTPVAEPTTARTQVVRPARPGSAIGELRRLSGLTWDQLANLFGVSRRSLHFWASGNVMTARNEERLYRVLSLFRWFDRGSASANRASLFAVRDGVTPFGLLAEGRLTEAMAILGKGRGIPRLPLLPISEHERRARAPLPPASFVDPLQDPIPYETGRARPAKSVRHRSGP